MLFQFILHPEKYVFTENCPVNVQPFVTINEKKGKSFIIEKTLAEQENIGYIFPCCCIQLKQETALTAIGITFQIAEILTKEKISCNVVAGFRYDYFFVPAAEGEKALNILNAARLTS